MSASREERRAISAASLLESSPKGESQANVVSLRDRCTDLEEGVRTHKVRSWSETEDTTATWSPLHVMDGGNVADIVSQFKNWP